MDIMDGSLSVQSGVGRMVQLKHLVCRAVPCRTCAANPLPARLSRCHAGRGGRGWQLDGYAIVDWRAGGGNDANAATPLALPCPAEHVQPALELAS